MMMRVTTKTAMRMAAVGHMVGVLRHQRIDQIVHATHSLHGFSVHSRLLSLNVRTATQMGFPVLIPGITHSGHGHRQHISTSKAIACRPPLSMDRSFSCGMSRPCTRIFDVLTATTHLTVTLLSHNPGDASASTRPFGSLGTVTVAADASTQKARSTL